jgi:hypothetical protein
MEEQHDALPAWQVSEWLNTATPPTLAGLRGQVVVVHAFQMLCPGCVAHGLPQARRIAQVFAGRDVAVLGLHTVFEHHAVMTPAALRVFLQEYRITFPVGIDRAAPVGELPLTMAAWGLQGTPSLLLFDRLGRLRLQHFGHLEDLPLGLALGQLLVEPQPLAGATAAPAGAPVAPPAACDDHGCAR